MENKIKLTVMVNCQSMGKVSVTRASDSTDVTSSNSVYEVDEGSVLYLEAEAANGFQFAGWSDGECDKIRKIHVSKEIEYYAVFVSQTKKNELKSYIV